MMTTFYVINLLIYSHLSFLKAACDFKVYDYADSDGYASANGSTRLSEADLAGTSPSVYKDELIAFLNQQSPPQIQALSAWTNGNCCMALSENNRIYWNGQGYLKVASDCDECILSFAQDQWYSLCMQTNKDNLDILVGEPDFWRNDVILMDQSLSRNKLLEINVFLQGFQSKLRF